MFGFRKKKPKKWANVRASHNPDEVHVVPLADEIEHGLTDNCPCDPEAQPQKRADGSVGWLIVHNAWDGRE